MRTLLVLLAALFVAACGADDTPSAEDTGAGIDVEDHEPGQMCGDGVIDEGEECDDGPAWNPGCLACRVSLGWSCSGEPSVCARRTSDAEWEDAGWEDAGWEDAGTTDADGPHCGDGFIDEGEECDDGDSRSANGCSSECRIEREWECEGEPSECRPICGNGHSDLGEECDDGNFLDRDGCEDCAVADGWTCEGEPSECQQICGNGVIEPGEECDDGDRDGSNGCGRRCQLLEGWICTGEPSVCAQSCGDGVVDVGEECDAGGDIPGCWRCVTTTGWLCSGTPSTCVRTCGDGVVDPGEECDDGDLRSLGCLSCAVVDGWACEGSPSVCVQRCGDGEVTGDEQCDFGDAEPGDGCDRGCRVETGWTCDGSGCVRDDESECGDGVVESDCDDGNLADGDGCSSACDLEEGWSCAGEPSVCSRSCAAGAPPPPCMHWAGSCSAVPAGFGEVCAGGDGYCDGLGTCIDGSVCDELPEGSECDDGSGALDLRCIDGVCAVAAAIECPDEGIVLDGRCFRRARAWHYPRGDAAVVSSRYYESISLVITAPNPVGVGPLAPDAYMAGGGSTRESRWHCALHPEAGPRYCYHVCNSSGDARVSGEVVERIVSPDGGSVAETYVVNARVRGVPAIHGSVRTSDGYGYPSEVPTAWAELWGIDVAECPIIGVGWAMVGGECVPADPEAAQCEGDEWVNLLHSNAHCGACGNPCGDDFECVEGECECRFDTDTDPNSCGACGNVCEPGADCLEGACVCPFDTETDPENCGACGNACADRHSCVAGACECDADVRAENPDACGGCPVGHVGRYCELACPIGANGEPCSGDAGLCVEENGEAVCRCFDTFLDFRPTCYGGAPECTFESSEEW